MKGKILFLVCYCALAMSQIFSQEIEENPALPSTADILTLKEPRISRYSLIQKRYFELYIDDKQVGTIKGKAFHGLGFGDELQLTMGDKTVLKAKGLSKISTFLKTTFTNKPSTKPFEVTLTDENGNISGYIIGKRHYASFTLELYDRDKKPIIVSSANESSRLMLIIGADSYSCFAGQIECPASYGDNSFFQFSSQFRIKSDNVNIQLTSSDVNLKDSIPVEQLAMMAAVMKSIGKGVWGYVRGAATVVVAPIVFIALSKNIN